MNEIINIDKQLNALYRKLRSLEKISPNDAGSWQIAWNKHPDLLAQECELYRQRGIAQQERNTKASNAWAQQQRQKRAKRPKKCPTCGCHTLAA